MAREEFIADIERALDWTRGQTLEVAGSTEEYALEAAALRGIDLWLTQNAVANFNECDWAGISDEQRAALRTHVSTFRDLARRAGPAAPVTKEDASGAKIELQEIARIITSASQTPLPG